jgi:putative ABC transport system permease protein
MLKNYFKIAFRQLLKNRVFSIINISGLTVGMAAVILLLLWIQNEVSYDTFHSKKDRIYNLWNKAFWSEKLTCWDVTPKVAAKTLKEKFPEVEKATRVDWPISRFMKCNKKQLYSQGHIVDTDFLSMFDFPLIEGNINSVFKNPNSIIITPILSKKLFGSENPIGKIIALENGQSLTVTGIINSPSNNTRFQFEYLIPWAFLESTEGSDNNWGNNSTRTYVMLKENASFEALQKKVKDLRKNYSKDTDIYDMFLYPMSRWRLHSNFEEGVETGGKIVMVRMLAIIAGFILLIACINFMNLSTARSEKRAKEVGIRKTVGAMRGSIIKQFLSETILLAFISFILSILIVQLCLPAYNTLIEKRLSIDYLSPIFWFFGLSFVLLTGFLAGSYPAFFLSAFNPTHVLKGTFKTANAVLTPRKVLVVIQFVFAIVLITATIIVKQQIAYVIARDNGYNKDKLVYHFTNKSLEKNYLSIKHELLNQNIAEAVTKTSAPITQGWSDSWGFTWDGKDPNDRTDFDRYCVDEDFIKTAGLQLVSGRDFNLKEYTNDSTGVIINESALKVIGFKDPLGKIIKDGDMPFHIVGIIKDFILNSPYQPTKPMIILGAKYGFFNVINIRLKNGISDMKKAEAVFKKYNPDYPFDCKFIDQEYASKFDDMQKVASLATLFAGLAIFISCLGLFGLASFMAENRIKEIGIRKVLGASVANITSMLSSNFIKLVFIAMLIAIPIAWWLMSNWLKDYSYRIELHWWTFALAGIISILISLATVSYQSFKAALSNPVKNLRTE